MECDVLTILDMIENLRRLMYDEARDKNLSDPELVSLSQSLDRLLNVYQTLEAKVDFKCIRKTEIQLPRRELG